MFKKASWVFACLMGALLLYTLSKIPSGDDSPLTLHLATRYLQKSEVETGIHSAAAAVAGDYRSFDLFAAGVLFSLSALILLTFSPAPARFAAFFPALFWIGGGLLTLGLGFFSLFHGSNFLDYEALGLGGDASARLRGVLLLTGGVLLSLGGLFLAVIQGARKPEGSGER